MKKPSRFLRILGVAGLLIGMLAATIAPAMAQEDNGGTAIGVPGFDSLLTDVEPAFLAGHNTIYFPWVANDDDFGLGPADTSISIQNLENRDSQIWIYTGNGDGTWSLATSAYLSRYASKTFTAAQLGIAAGDGAPVAVIAYHVLPGTITVALIETTVILSNPITAEEGGGESTQVLACVVNEHLTDGYGSPYPFVAAADFTYDGDSYVVGDLVEWSSQSELQAILNAANEGNTGPLVNPFGGLNNDGDCFDRVGSTGSTGQIFDSVAIGGVAKQAVEGNNLPSTTGADTAVSGYNALNGSELAQFDQWYLPIVQTNGGPGGTWNSIIRVANVTSLNSAVTVRFFPSDDGSGSLQTGFQIQQLVHGGDTWHINLSDYVPEGWVGSAHIYSDGTVFAMVDRYKVGYNMWISNTGSSADWENIAQVPGSNGRYALFAPHVLMDYFGWNTGINVANLVNADNNVSIQYFNLLGNATEVLNQRLAPHGMTYFYDPSSPPQGGGQDVVSDPNAGVVGSAIIWSQHPVAAAVDATKYPETDPTGGVDLFQATSYSATANVFTWQAVPLVQKGNPVDGMGDTSGINIMNPNPSAVTANVYFVNPSGFNAQNFGTSSVTIPGFANGFVYTLWQHNLPNGFTGAAQVIASQPVVAVSANVNYQVDGDGSAIFNAFNPCGLYRVSGACSFGDPFEPGDQSVTKTFLDTAGNPVAGVGFQIVSTPGTTDFPYQRNGISGLDGSQTFTSVPVGVYDLFVTSVPAGYATVDPNEVQETFVVTEGANVTLTNILEFGQTFTKTVIVAGSDLDDEDDSAGVTLAGVGIVIYEQIGTDGGGDPVVDTDPVFTGTTNAAGQISTSLAAGNYVLCMYAPEGEATLPNGEVVPVDLGDTATPAGDCEAFEIVADESLALVNEVDLDGTAGAGLLDIDLSVIDGLAITLQQTTDNPAAGLEIDFDGETFVSDENGLVTITGLNDGTHTITFDSNDAAIEVLDAIGGLLNASNVTNDETSITFDYSITDDVAQDGVLHDNANGGTSDLSVALTDDADGPGGPDDPEGPTGTVTKFFLNRDEFPLSGVEFCLAPAGAADADACIETAITNSEGSATVTLPVGTYDLFVIDAPTGYELPTGVADEDIDVFEDDDTELYNILEFAEGAGTVVKTFVDTDNNPVSGVEFYIENSEAFSYDQPVEGPAGTYTFTGVGADVYNLYVTSVPDGYELPTGSQEEFRVLADGTVNLTNVLFDADQSGLLVIGLLADLDLLGIASLDIEVYANPEYDLCSTVVAGSAVPIATAIGIDAGDFAGLYVGVAELVVDGALLAEFGATDADDLIDLQICLAATIDLGGGQIVEAQVLVPATIGAVGNNYVANAELEGTSINLNLLSALSNLLPGGLADLNVTVYANTSGSACGDLSAAELAALPVLATDLTGAIVPISACIEVEANVLGLDLLGAVIGVDLTPGAERTLNAGVQLLPLPGRITLSLD